MSSARSKKPDPFDTCVFKLHALMDVCSLSGDGILAQINSRDAWYTACE